MHKSLFLIVGANLDRWLNIGIIVACFTLLVSLIDFLLTPAQKKKIDIFIDGITLRLDYTKTLDWLQRWLKASRRAEIVEKFFVAVAAIPVIAILGGIVFLLFTTEVGTWWGILGFGLLFLVVWLWQWTYVMKAYENVGVPIIKSLAESESYFALLESYMFVIFGGAFVLAICIALLYVIATLTEHWWVFFRGLLGMAGNFVLGMILCWIGLILDGIVTMLGALGVHIIRTVIDSLRWLMWRISSYQKGALMGTLTLVGAVLAILKIFLSK